MLAALDFASPLAYAFRVPTPAEAEPAQEQIETIWNGSIIQMQNGDWLQFAGMHGLELAQRPRFARPLLARRRIERA